MNSFALVLLFIVNFAISWFNAWAVGVGWVESKFSGGWPRFLAWCGAVMSACGFTWCLLAVVGPVTSFAAARLGHPVPERYLHGFYSLGYLVIILPVLGSGLGLTVDAWGYYWRRRTFGGGAVAAWDTFAQVSNMMSALSDIPDAFSGVVGMFSSDDDDDGVGCLVVLFLVSVCLLGGILLTRHIVLSTARRHYQGLRSSLRHARQP